MNSSKTMFFVHPKMYFVFSCQIDLYILYTGINQFETMFCVWDSLRRHQVKVTQISNVKFNLNFHNYHLKISFTTKKMHAQVSEIIHISKAGVVNSYIHFVCLVVVFNFIC